MTESRLPSHVLRCFVETLSTGLGPDALPAVLKNAGLPAEWACTEKYLGPLDDAHAADAYARLQAALRTYYGRGARGTLMRIGEILWESLLGNASFTIKTQATLVRRFPVGLRRKPALELLARLLSAKEGDLAVHTLDLNLLLVDHACPSAMGQSASAPICFVTQGLVREALYWAVGQEHDIEETSCRAMGAADCKFKITLGG
jgi:predicted hydrocarbon binding protein